MFIARLPILLGCLGINSLYQNDDLKCNPEIKIFLDVFIVPYFIIRWILLCLIKCTSLLKIERSHLTVCCLEALTALTLLIMARQDMITLAKIECIESEEHGWVKLFKVYTGITYAIYVFGGIFAVFYFPIWVITGCKTGAEGLEERRDQDLGALIRPIDPEEGMP